MSPDKQLELAEVEAIARELASTFGLEIVSFIFHGQGRHSQLRIDIDRAGPAGVNLADCETFSRAFDARLEASGLLDATYELQVSSPGIDRPIRSPDDLRRSSGRPVRVEFRDEAGKAREARGVLAWDPGTDTATVAGESGEVHVPRDRILLMKQEVRPSGRKRNGA